MLAAPSAQAVLGGKRTLFAPFVPRALGVLSSDKLRNVRNAARRKAAERFPQQRAVDHGLRLAWRADVPPQPATVDAGRVDHRAKHDVTRLIDLDLDLLERQRWMRAAAERGYLELCSLVFDLKDEGGVQLATAKVVVLANETHTLRRVGKPHAAELPITRKRIGGACRRFHASNGMVTRQ